MPLVLAISKLTYSPPSSCKTNGGYQWDRVRGGRSLRLPTEPCVRVRTRLLTQDVSIDEHQTSAPASDQNG